MTAFFQPYSFTVLGAAGKNDEIRFEGAGITLSQALGRMAACRTIAPTRAASSCSAGRGLK